MTTSRCSHLPEVLPDCTSSAVPVVKTVEDCSSLVNGQPQYVMQVSAKDGQLLSTVVRTLTTQSPFNDRPMCRICHEGSSQEDLLSPCECTGTLGTIHRSCLEHWLSSSNTTYCELCHFRFSVERKPRPLVEWLRNPGPQHEKRTLFGDMVCFLFITPLATISGWLCLRGAVDHLHFSSRLEAVGLIALTVALFTIYLFWTLWRGSSQRTSELGSKSSLLNPVQTEQGFECRYRLGITVDCTMNGVGPIKELYFSSQSLPASLQTSSPCWACIQSKGTQRRQSSNCATTPTQGS